MRRIGTRNSALLVAVTIAALGGSVYTASISGAGVGGTKVMGYGATTITGATAHAVAYTYDTDHSHITQLDVALNGDTSASTLSVNYNATAPTACATGVYDGSTYTDYV